MLLPYVWLSLAIVWLWLPPQVPAQTPSSRFGVSAAWLALAIVSHIIERMVGGLEASYFWSQVSARSLSLIRPALLLAFGLAMTTYGARRLGSPMLAAAGIALLALPACVIGGLTAIDGRMQRLERDLVRIDAEVGPTLPWATLSKQSEAQIYYALSRYLDTGR